jgi:eukaryotic-like serine/threonine-protein kinase
VFVFDPENDSNRPAPGIHEVVKNFWAIYPKSLRDLFTCGFTRGLCDPSARVMDNTWRKEMCRLRDSIYPCAPCGAELFFDIDYLRSAGALPPCWACQRVPSLPPRMRIGDVRNAAVVVLSPGAQLFPHHLSGDAYNFTTPIAEVMGNPLGLINRSRQKWTARSGERPITEIPPGTVFQVTSPCRIHFGGVEAEVRL